MFNLPFAAASFQSISLLAFTEKLLLKVSSTCSIRVNHRKLLAVIGNLIFFLFAAFSVWSASRKWGFRSLMYPTRWIHPWCRQVLVKGLVFIKLWFFNMWKNMCSGIDKLYWKGTVRWVTEQRKYPGKMKPWEKDMGCHIGQWLVGWT